MSGVRVPPPLPIKSRAWHKFAKLFCIGSSREQPIRNHESVFVGYAAHPIGGSIRQSWLPRQWSRYRAAQADEQAWIRARRPKSCKLAISPRLRQTVARKLRLHWSPEQIAGWLKRSHPGEEAYHVSHETIYRSLFVQARGVLKKELLLHLRSKRTIRRSRLATGKGDGRGQIKDIISIRERPASVEDRKSVV